MMPARKAFLVDIASRIKYDNTPDPFNTYIHYGVYRSDDYIFLAVLDLDPYNPSPSLFGDIAEVYNECTILYTLLPIQLCFNAILKSKNIIQNHKTISHPTQILGFKDSLKFNINFLNKRLIENPNNLADSLALRRCSDEKVISKFSTIICEREIPYSSYSYNKEKNRYMSKGFYLKL